jgi:hypothetical protein
MSISNYDPSVQFMVVLCAWLIISALVLYTFLFLTWLYDEILIRKNILQLSKKSKILKKI